MYLFIMAAYAAMTAACAVASVWDRDYLDTAAYSGFIALMMALNWLHWA